MKIAVLHWHSSSVGGINTTLQTYRTIADQRGDQFHVFASNPQRTKQPQLFRERLRVRGGDSFIMIDGYAPYHADNLLDTVRFLSTYDVVMTSFLCPHPTKDYGEEPLFLPFLKKITAPLIGYIHDAYWATYREWGLAAAALCDLTVINQPAYAPAELLRLPSALQAYVPFTPLGPAVKKTAKRDEKRVLWMPQWKNIKGIHKFFHGIPALVRRGFRVGLYNNGIEYYKLRLTPDWRCVVGRDHFASDYSGLGRAVEFFGCRPAEELGGIFSSAGFAVDFQGHAAKYAAYLNGSYNHTILEALYYGSVPVVSANMLKSGIPKALLLPIEDFKTYPEMIAGYPVRTYPRKTAREYVEDKFNGERLYDRIFANYRRRTARR